MKAIKLFAVLTIANTATAPADSYVNGYIKRDGTYVAPHIRSSPDQYRYNNYGSQTRGGNQRDEFSSNPAYNLSNPSFGYSDNDGDGIVNSYDNAPNSGNRW